MLSGARMDGSRSNLPMPKSATLVPDRCCHNTLLASVFTEA